MRCKSGLLRFWSGGLAGWILLASIALLAGGCASPWQSNFEPNPALEGRKFAPTQSVQIRTVEPQRLQQYAQAERQRRVASTTAPQDLPPQERLAAKNRLLEALQLQERGDEVEILGWSEFKSFEKLSPRDPRLEKFAKKIGADYVIVAADYAGKVARTIDRPLTTYSHSYVTVPGGRGGRGPRTIVRTDTSTTWVPMTVVEDEYFYTAAFVRKLRPGESP
ncbi:hypothetical protein [Fontivita pretiosa]|jgi:hypothetical protein|uniref:hypothetical protein n=1 Tax=Fontivita pretiosa TaxID=2989684 RepID=UPI003D173014